VLLVERRNRNGKLTQDLQVDVLLSGLRCKRGQVFASSSNEKFDELARADSRFSDETNDAVRETCRIAEYR
jgi:hypothetical protein